MPSCSPQRRKVRKGYTLKPFVRNTFTFNATGIVSRMTPNDLMGAHALLLMGALALHPSYIHHPLLYPSNITAFATV